MTNKEINNYLFIPLLVLFLLLQLTFIPQFFSGAVAPNIVLILLLAASLLYKTPDIFYFVFICGFVLDIFSGPYLGPAIISFLVSIFVSAYFGYYFLKETPSLVFLLIIIGSIAVYNAVYFVLINFDDFNQIFGNLSYLFYVVAVEAIFAIIIVYPLTFLISYRK